MKEPLRRRMRAILRDVSPEVRRERSRVACRRLTEQPEWQSASAIFVHVSTWLEIDTTPLTETAWAERRRVLAPKVVDEERGRMVPVEIRKWTDCIVGYRNLLEPLDDTAVPADEIDLVLTPGLAFDTLGLRLGQGGGYYDRFLADPELRARTCGYAYEAQCVDRVPAEPHDRPVDLLVTEATVRRFGDDLEN